MPDDSSLASSGAGASPEAESVRPGVVLSSRDHPNSCCTIEAPGGLLVTLDWACVLQRAYRSTLEITTGTMWLDLYDGSEVELDQEQTAHLLCYLTESSDDSFYGTTRVPKELLAHPRVKEIVSRRKELLLAGRSGPEVSDDPTEANKRENQNQPEGNL